MSIGALTRQLLELGASAAVVECVLEYFTVTSPLRHASREKANARQRAYRKRHKNQREAKANDVASSDASVTSPERHAASLHCDEGKKLSDEGLKKEKKAGDTRARGTRLETGAILTEPYRQAAIDLGAAPAAIPDLWAEFVDYWIAIPGSRGCKSDWPATWRNRVRDVLGKGRSNGHRANAYRSHTAAGGRETGTDAILAGVAAAASRRSRERGQAAVSAETAVAGELDLDRH